MTTLSEWQYLFEQKGSELPHFIIIRHDEFFHLDSFLLSINYRHDDPDLCLIDPDNENSDDKIMHKTYHQFLSTKALKKKIKLTLFLKAHKISHSLYNKLLKTFESPPEKTLTILFALAHFKLLPTIEGRGITLHLQSDSLHSPQIRDEEEILTSAAIEKSLQHPHSFEELDKLFEIIKENEEHRRYNGPEKARTHLLL